MLSPWKIVSGSMIGTSHQKCGELCQDYSHWRILDGSSILILACADGAGSAACADLAARMACLGFVHAAATALDSAQSINAICEENILDWYDQVRCRLSLEACLRSRELNDFACTLLTAIVGERGAFFSQIGDGVIVFRDGSDYKTAFWPQSGEYANTTFFLTGRDFRKHASCSYVQGALNDIAILSDGLQPLALHYASRTVHRPFFEPMFARLQNAPTPEDLSLPLREFLASRAVVDRTDDDKTLILATRQSADNVRG